jgi:hypothetical protein
MKTGSKRDAMKKQIKEKYSRLFDDLANEDRHERVTVFNADKILLEHFYQKTASNFDGFVSMTGASVFINTFREKQF